MSTGQTKTLIHGEYNEREYEVLAQIIPPNGEIEWEEVFRRSAAELRTSPEMDPDRMREHCLETCKDEVQNRDNANLGDVLYQPLVYADGSESDVPEGHESW